MAYYLFIVINNTNSINEYSSILGALIVFGDKWTPLLVKQLSDGPKTFSALEKILPGISPRTLSQRLDKLIGIDIIGKQLYCAKPPRYQYYLTPKGADLQNILTAMAIWSEKYR